MANKLSLNVKKSNVILFRRKNEKIPPTNININGCPIEEKEYAKYLGILIDNRLAFHQQIQHVNSRLTRGIAILSMLRHYVPKTTLLNTYHAYIQPHLDYGINIWGHTYKTHLNSLKRKQRKAIRIMNFKSKHYNPQELFISDRVLPFDENLQLSAGKLLWNYI